MEGVVSERAAVVLSYICEGVGILSLYDRIPNDFLAGFFVEFNKNIKKGILSAAMYQEIDLIRAAADRRGLSEKDLREIYRRELMSRMNRQLDR